MPLRPKKPTAPTTNRAYFIGILGAAVLTVIGTVLVEAVKERHTFEVVPDKPETTSGQSEKSTQTIPPPVKPVRFGFQATCSSLAPAADVRAILDMFGQQAMAGAPVALVQPTKEPVTVAASVGGADDGGVLQVNTRVHVICMADANFAVIKEEHGNHEGVVERRVLREP
jgi:hypothetical protein